MVSRPIARVALAWLPFALIVFIGVAVSAYLSFRGAQYAEAQARADFERQAVDEIGALKVRINASFSAVTALAALYEARGDVGREEFQRFAATIQTANPSISGAGVGAGGGRGGARRGRTAIVGRLWL